MSKHRLLFVVGVGRSGTTLLQALLNAHKNIRFLPEINYIRRFLFRDELRRTVAQGGVVAIGEQLSSDSKVSRLGYDLREVVTEAASSGSNLPLAILDRIIARTAQPSTTYVGYKDARLVENIPQILQQWPDAHIVHIVRDPRDVLASRKKADWSSDYPVWRNVLAGRIQLALASQQATDSRILEIRYEDLVSDSDRIARSLCDFLELKFDPQMLEFHRSAGEVVFSDEMQWKSNLFSPIMTQNSAKWVGELTDAEVATVERSMRGVMDKFNYQSSGADQKLSLRQKLWVLGNSVIISIASTLYGIKRATTGT